MKIFAAQNDKKSLMNHYGRYVKVLKKELGISPDGTIVDLYKNLIMKFNDKC